ncbi:MAG TPA: sigma 54-interacting transcriptional regulator [Isosphaeraceae bacterium]|nr:sigma 54-interacting transcriptional regulator [Isosphaeraceae bacterium]
MERFAHLLLGVWREACRHIQIGESVERVAPLLGHRLPVDLVLIRHFDLQRPCAETVAVGSCRPGPVPTRARTECSSQDLECILAWCRRGEVIRQQARTVSRRLPALLPTDVEGEVLAGPLNTEGGPAGVLLLVARLPHEFRAEHEELLHALLEPFTVALENDRRLRELTALREAVEADNRSLLSRLGRYDITDSIVGAETGLRPVMEQIELVARSDTPVLVLGETGSGKEVVTRAIHNRSRRASGPFLRVNCGAIPPELVDSELFGHERGSFTGAVGVRKGWFERADGGTLFLDECGELPPAAQVRLLRILQDGLFERVGGERQLHVDVRIVAATHRDLQALVADSRFREDLWYRIAIFPIRLPPLRDRTEDIPALATHFALRAAKRLGMPPLVPSAEDICLLISYPWPGNVRELAAVIERAAILGGGDRLEVAQALGTAPPRSPPQPVEASPPNSRSDADADAELLPLAAIMARHIEAALIRSRGRIEGSGGAAALLNINPHTLRARMRKLGVDWRRFRTGPH